MAIPYLSPQGQQRRSINPGTVLPYFFDEPPTYSYSTEISIRSAPKGIFDVARTPAPFFSVPGTEYNGIKIAHKYGFRRGREKIYRLEHGICIKVVSQILYPIILFEIFPLPGVMIVNAQIITIIAQLRSISKTKNQFQ